METLETQELHATHETDHSAVTPSDRKIRERRMTKAVSKKPTKIERLNKPSKLVELPVTEFSVDLRVQRNLNELRVAEMAADFRPDSLGLVTASRRADGQTYVLDGAHRISAGRVAQYTGLYATRLFTDLTLSEEAGLFLTLNSTKSVQAIDRFKVRVTLGDRIAVNINNVLKSYGLHVDWSAAKESNTISAIVTLEKVYRGAGVRPDGEYSDLVDKVVGTIARAYKGDRSGAVFSRTLMEGMGILWAHFGSRIERGRLEEVLGDIPPRQFIARTRNLRDARGGSLGENAAEVLHSLYNHRRRDKLPEFAHVDPRNNHIPATDYTQDPLYVDPAAYVKAERESERETLSA